MLAEAGKVVNRRKCCQPRAATIHHHAGCLLMFLKCPIVVPFLASSLRLSPGRGWVEPGVRQGHTYGSNWRVKAITVVLFATDLTIFVLLTYTMLDPSPEFMAGDTGVDQDDSGISPDHYLTHTSMLAWAISYNKAHKAINYLFLS